jgi:nitroreductase
MDKVNNKQIIQALKWRYATKKFDQSKTVDKKDLDTILKSGSLSPSSLGLEPWKFIVVKNKELCAKIREAGYDQPQITDASCLIIVTRRKDTENLSRELIFRTAAERGVDESELEELKQMVDNFISTKPSGPVREGWISAQTYIALGIMIETAALLGIDACPMEGFNSLEVDKILGLSEKNLASVTLFAVGYRGQDQYADNPKTRRKFNEAVEFID